MSLFSNNTSVKKPFCKVCFDAKKTEAIYTGHWVRSLPNIYGVVSVTCPTLLNNPCRHCNTVGHTVAFCKGLKQDQRAERTAIYNNKTHNVPTQYIIQGKKENAFRELVDDNSSEEEDEDEGQQEEKKTTADAPQHHLTNKDRKKNRKIKKKNRKLEKSNTSQHEQEWDTMLTSSYNWWNSSVVVPTFDDTLMRFSVDTTPSIPVASKKVVLNWADSVESDDSDDDDDF